VGEAIIEIRSGLLIELGRGSVSVDPHLLADIRSFQFCPPQAKKNEIW
jgi:hypothetical protein